MKKKIVWGIGAVFVAIALAIVVSVIQDNSWKYGVPEKSVPAYEVLVENLTREGYLIQEEDQALNSDIKAKRVIATKGKKYIDICYELEDADVEKVFEKYRENYEDTSFFVLAQNMNYVYCVSDKRTFKKSGFTSMANDGYQIEGKFVD